MWSSSRTIQVGDTVIIYQTRENITSLVITPGKTFSSKFGTYTHDSFLDVPYGSKIASSSKDKRGFIYALRPTPELWTLALPHRTQILYIGDISFISTWLDLRGGKRVLEAGTGSGSFSHSLSRTIGPRGELRTFEFHHARYQKALEEFGVHRMSNVRISHRNVCKEGFGDESDGWADAVFLDMPAPWEAVPHACKALRKDMPSRIASFSPCIEQVLRTIGAMNAEGFTGIETYEVLVRPWEVYTVGATEKTTSQAAESLKESERKREERRKRQVEENTTGRKRKEGPSEEEGRQEKRVRVDPTLVVGRNVGKVLPETRGHTSYLTFAILIPTPQQEQEQEQEPAMQVDE